MARRRGELSPVMRIAVIGTGNIGGTLGWKWSSAGHDVVYGSRSSVDAGPGGAPVLTVGEAIDGADVVALAVPGKAAAELIAAHGPALADKIVIDAANRIGEPEVNSKAAVRAAAPQARYVRAFNTLGWENFADPVPSAALFFAADPPARQVTEELIAAVGLEPACVGDADAAGIVDGVLPLWFALVRQHGGDRRLAFRVVR
jgi:predicted dinucleotide-binding enzyme